MSYVRKEPRTQEVSDFPGFGAPGSLLLPFVQSLPTDPLLGTQASHPSIQGRVEGKRGSN